MKRSEQGYIIRNYFKRLNKYAEQMKKGFNEEAIHLFRVDVKKLRAFMRMMRPMSEEPGHLKFPHEFKKMYSIAGKIRDRQLCLKRLKEHTKNKDSGSRKKIQVLEKEIEELAGKKSDFITKKELSEIEEKIIKQIPVLPGEALITTFFQQKLDVINEVVSKGDYKDKELHSIRKNIKDIIYIARIFRDDVKAPLPFSFWNKAELKKAESLSHTLGLFNDACIALSFLKPANIKKAGTKEKEHLFSMRRQWLAEKLNLKKEILTGILAIMPGKS